MSSRPEHPTQTTGAHPARDVAPGRDRDRVPKRAERPERAEWFERTERFERYAPHLDGLFTYCLSVLCEHDAATAVLGEVLALAERHHSRRPSDPALYRPWLYALARWACLRHLAERPPPPAGLPKEVPAARRRELAALAWPEAAGTTPEQREALELSVRHRLPYREVAAVLGLEPIATRALLSAASCEVERTRAALSVVEFGRCPDVAQLAGDTQMLLGAALRRELVRHVDECAECRRTAERATARGPWPGTAPVTHGALPLVLAPQAEVRAAMAAAQHSRSGRAEGVAGAAVGAAAARERGKGSTRRAGRMVRGGSNGVPRYDRSGFPVGPKDRAARRRRLRSRALTTTVVATVMAAPVLALWAAYRGGPLAGEEQDSPSVTANETDGQDRLDGRPYENAGSARTSPDPPSAAPRVSDVSVKVLGRNGLPLPAGEADRARTGPGRLAVTARPSGATTLITITASGGTSVRWAASGGAPWLLLSATGGELRPGQSTTLTVHIDRAREPSGPWAGHILIEPSGAVVVIEGRGAGALAPGPAPSRPDPAPSWPGHTPAPSGPPPSGSPAPGPTPPDPPPTGGDPAPGEPTPGTPAPGDPTPGDPSPAGSTPGSTGPTSADPISTAGSTPTAGEPVPASPSGPA